MDKSLMDDIQISLYLSFGLLHGHLSMKFIIQHLLRYLDGNQFCYILQPSLAAEFCPNVGLKFILLQHLRVSCFVILLAHTFFILWRQQRWKECSCVRSVQGSAKLLSSVQPKLLSLVRPKLSSVRPELLSSVGLSCCLQWGLSYCLQWGLSCCLKC